MAGLVHATYDDLDTYRFRRYLTARQGSNWNVDAIVDWSRASQLPDDRRELAWRVSSGSVFAEQLGLVTASRLLAEADDYSARLALAVAVSDEAKHSEAFARYARWAWGSDRLAGSPEDFQPLVDAFNSLDDMPARFIVHTTLEGFALDEFTLLIEAFSGDPLADIYRHVLRDEARHVAMGIDYISAALRDMHPADATAYIDEHIAFAIEAVGLNSETYEWIGRATGRRPNEVEAWFARRHHSRRGHLLDTASIEGGWRDDLPGAPRSLKKGR